MCLTSDGLYQMVAEPIISVSGLRGIVGESLTPEVAQRYVEAYCQVTPSGPIVVTRDGRANGPPLAAAILEAVARSGRKALDGGVAATPTTGVLIREHAAAGGIQLSASHNPPQYNGIKLFNAAGRVIPAIDGQKVIDAFRGTSPGTRGKTTQGIAAKEDIADVVSTHLSLITSIVDVKRIQRRRFRVLLDANHGSGSVLGKPFLNFLACELVTLGETPDGLFAHPPEPTEANLSTILSQVVSEKADIGFCQDPDADRLAIIDERGRFVGEEKTLALCVDHLLRNGSPGPIVTNCSTSRMTEVLAVRYGAPFFRSKVGEANVVDVMLETNATLGGEGNGGVIEPRVGLVRDSFVGMALVLDAMASRELPLSALSDELPQFAIHKATVSLPPDRVEGAIQALAARFSDAAKDLLDGLRIDFADGAWLLVRPSNTEPLVRVIAEAHTAEAARKLCDEAAETMQRFS